MNQDELTEDQVLQLISPFSAQRKAQTAQTYARAAMDGTVANEARLMRIDVLDALEHQALYIIGNAQTWHGNEARRAKEALKAWLKTRN